MKPLLRKNIESIFVDLLVIAGFCFVSEIKISIIVYLCLLLFSYFILVISKRPPKNFFLQFLYALSVILPVLGLFPAKDLLFNMKEEIAAFSIQSIVILAFAFVVFIVFLISYSKKEKLYAFTQTFLVPLLFSLLILATAYITTKYAKGIFILVVVYIPLRFLMAYKEPVRWYQFIMLLAGMAFAFHSAIDNNGSPVTPLSKGLASVNANISYTIHDDYENDTVIKVLIDDVYLDKYREGEYFFVVSRICDNKWMLDKLKTIEYYKENDKYHYSDSTELRKLFYNIEFRLQLEADKELEINDYRKDADKYFARCLCDTAGILIKQEKYPVALVKLDTAQKHYQTYNKIYYLKSLAFIGQNGLKDSICSNLTKAIGYNNIDALSLYRQYCFTIEK